MSIARISAGILPLCLLALALTGCSTGGGTAGVALNGNGNNAASRFTPNYGAAVTFQRWDHFPIKVAFTNDVSVSGTSLRSVVLAGFDKWVTATGGVIGYTVVTDPATADMPITFQNLGATPGKGDTLGLTTRTYFPSTLQITSVAMSLNYWPTMTGAQAFQGLKSTAAHEFGHALGIVGHSPNSDDIMFLSGSINGDDKAVTTRDLNTIKSDYDSLF